YRQSLHDHPWDFISIILKGGYNEVTETTAPGIGEKYELITPGRILYRPAEWRQRVELINEQQSWSIILVGQRKRKWGFWPNGKWCFWRKFDYSNNICEEDILGLRRPPRAPPPSGARWPRPRRTDRAAPSGPAGRAEVPWRARAARSRAHRRRRRAG